MKEVKLEPDDLLTGVGTVREETEIDCPGCGESTVVPTKPETGVCTNCDEVLQLEKPF